MPFPLSRDALQHVLAGVLTRQLMPKLSDPGDRALVSACVDLCVREELQRSDTDSELDATLEHDIAALSGSADGSTQRAGAERRLLERLASEEKHYRNFEQRVSEHKGQLEQVAQDVFPAPTEIALNALLRHRFPADPLVHACNVKVTMGGTSKQTVLFDVVAGDGKTQALVMRRDYPNSFVATSVVNEFPLLAALWREGYAVPEPIWLETDGTHVPGVHLVMRRVEGSQAGDSFSVRPDLADKALPLFAELLGRLHSLPLAKLDIVGFSAETFNESSLLNTIDYWYQRYRADAAQPEAILEIGYAWLRSNIHRGLQEPVLVHGELGFHNLMADSEKFTAVLDWELTHVGSPAEDLAYVKEYVEWVGAFDEFVEHYQRAGGPIPNPEALHYYELFKYVRNGGIYLSAIQSFNRGLNDNPLLPSFCLQLYSSYVKKIHGLLRQVMGGNGVGS